MHGLVFSLGTRIAKALKSKGTRLDLAPTMTVSNKIIHLMNVKWKHFWLLFHIMSNYSTVVKKVD